MKSSPFKISSLDAFQKGFSTFHDSDDIAKIFCVVLRIVIQNLLYFLELKLIF